jgi:hypothetical protein
MARMNRHVYLPLSLLISLASLALTACGTVPNEVVPLDKGMLRAPTYIQAAAYCQNKGLTAQMLGEAPAQTGVLFRCGD